MIGLDGSVYEEFSKCENRGVCDTGEDNTRHRAQVNIDFGIL